MILCPGPHDSVRFRSCVLLSCCCTAWWDDVYLSPSQKTNRFLRNKHQIFSLFDLLHWEGPEAHGYCSLPDIKFSHRLKLPITWNPPERWHGDFKYKKRTLVLHNTGDFSTVFSPKITGLVHIQYTMSLSQLYLPLLSSQSHLLVAFITAFV